MLKPGLASRASVLAVVRRTRPALDDHVEHADDAAQLRRDPLGLPCATEHADDDLSNSVPATAVGESVHLVRPQQSSESLHHGGFVDRSDPDRGAVGERGNREKRRTDTQGQELQLADRTPGGGRPSRGGGKGVL